MGLNRSIKHHQEFNQSTSKLPEIKNTSVDSSVLLKDQENSSSTEVLKLPPISAINEKQNNSAFDRLYERTWIAFKTNILKTAESTALLGLSLIGAISNILTLGQCYHSVTNIQANSIEGLRVFFNKHTKAGSILGKDAEFFQSDFWETAKKMNVLAYLSEASIMLLFNITHWLWEEGARGSMNLTRFAIKSSGGIDTGYLSHNQFLCEVENSNLLKFSKGIFEFAEFCLGIALSLASGGQASPMLRQSSNATKFFKFFKMNSAASWFAKEQYNLNTLKNITLTSGVMSSAGALGEELMSEEGFTGSRFLTNLNSGMAHSSIFSGSLTQAGKGYAYLKTKSFNTSLAKANKQFLKLRAGIDFGDGLGDMIDTGFDVENVGFYKKEQEQLTTLRKFIGWGFKVFAAGLDTIDDRSSARKSADLVQKLKESQRWKKTNLQQLQEEYLSKTLDNDAEHSTAQFLELKEKSQNTFAFYDQQANITHLPTLADINAHLNFRTYSPRLKHLILAIFAFHEECHRRQNVFPATLNSYSREIDAWKQTAKFARKLGVELDFSTGELKFIEQESASTVLARIKRLEIKAINQRNKIFDNYLPEYTFQLPKRTDIRNWVRSNYSQNSSLDAATVTNKRARQIQEKLGKLHHFMIAPEDFSLEQAKDLYYSITKGQNGEEIKRATLSLIKQRPAIYIRLQMSAEIFVRIQTLNKSPELFLSYELLAVENQIDLFQKTFPDSQNPTQLLNSNSTRILKDAHQVAVAGDLLHMDVVAMLLGFGQNNAHYLKNILEKAGINIIKRRTGSSLNKETCVISAGELLRYCESLGKESPPYRLLQEYYQGTTAELIINLRRRPYIRSSLADKIRGLREGRTSKTENSASKYVYGTGQYTKFILLEDVIKILKSEGKKNEAQILQELREQFAQDQDQAFEVYQQRLAAIKKEPQQKTLKNHSFELRNIFPLFGFSSDNRSPSIPEIIISLFESNKIFPIKVLVGKGAKRTKYSRRVNLEMIINLFKKLNCEDQAFRIAKVENLILEGELGLEDIPDQLRMIARANPCLGSKDTASILGYSVSHLPAIANQYKLNGKGLASISWTAGDGQRANKKYLLDDILIYLDETLGLRALAYTLKAKRNEFVNEQGLVDSAKLSKITEEAKASLDHKP